MALRSTLLWATVLSLPFYALYACGSSPVVTPPADASVPDTSVPDTSIPDVGPFDSGGVFPCDQKICGLGSEVCCYGAVGSGACMAVVDAAALPICTSPTANEFDCAATGDCDAGVCCANLTGSTIHSLCQQGCQPSGAITSTVVLCNGPYDFTTCKAAGKTCQSAPGAYPGGYYFCNK